MNNENLNLKKFSTPVRGPSLWPSGIDVHLWRVLEYPMFIELEITPGLFGVLWVHIAWYKKCVWGKKERKIAPIATSMDQSLVPVL